MLGGVPYISRGTEAGQAALNVSFRATTRPHSRVDAKVSTVLTQTFSPCSIDTSSSPFGHTVRALRIDGFTALLSRPEARTASDDLGNRSDRQHLLDARSDIPFSGPRLTDSLSGARLRWRPSVACSRLRPADDLAQSRASTMPR